MRVTDKMIFDSATRYDAAASARLADASAVASTGVKVQHAADDPGAAALIAQHTQAVARADAIAKATGAASDELGAVDGALAGVGNALSRARELAVQLSNSSYSAADRASGAAEVQGLLQQALGALNTRVGRRYVLGGTADGTPPFDAGGNYLGDTNVRAVEVAPGVQVAASVRADVAVKGAGGGTDALATLQALATALSSNDVAGVQGSLGALDASIAQVATARSQAGASMAAFDDARSMAQSASTLEKTAVSNLQEADTATALSQLALAQRALESALTASAGSFKYTLLEIK